MLYLDVNALENHSHDQYLTDIILGLDLNELAGRRLRAAFPEFFCMSDAAQMTPWSFLRRRFNLLESYSHPEPTEATVRYLNLPLEEFYSHEVPAVLSVCGTGDDSYNGLRTTEPRLFELAPEEVEGAETRFYALEIIPLNDDSDDDHVLVTAVSLAYLDMTR